MSFERIYYSAASPKIFTLFSLNRVRTGASKGCTSVIIFWLKESSSEKFIIVSANKKTYFNGCHLNYNTGKSKRIFSRDFVAGSKKYFKCICRWKTAIRWTAGIFTPVFQSFYSIRLFGGGEAGQSRKRRGCIGRVKGRTMRRQGPIPWQKGRMLSW